MPLEIDCVVGASYSSMTSVATVVRYYILGLGWFFRVDAKVSRALLMFGGFIHDP